MSAESAKTIKQEFLRLAFAVGMVFVSLFGGLIAINRLVMHPKTFGDVQALVRLESREEPLTSVSVELFHENGTLLATGRTDADGVFSHGRLPVGTYRLRFLAVEAEPVEATFLIQPRQSARLMVTIPTGAQEDSAARRPMPNALQERLQQELLQEGRLAAKERAQADREASGVGSDALLTTPAETSEAARQEEREPAAGQEIVRETFSSVDGTEQPAVEPAVEETVGLERITDAAVTATSADLVTSEDQQVEPFVQDLDRPAAPGTAESDALPMPHPVEELDAMIDRLLADLTFESVDALPAPIEADVVEEPRRDMTAPSVPEEADVPLQQASPSANWSSGR